MSNRRTHVAKAWASLFAAAAIGGALVWQITDVWSGSGTVDQGSRMLVVVSTSDTEESQDLIVHANVGTDGLLRLVFFLRSSDLADEWRYVPVDYHVTFANAALDSPITCGAGESTARTAYDDLDDGAKAAVQRDLIASRNSALNFEQPNSLQPSSPTGSAPSPANVDGPEPDANEIAYETFAGQLGLLGPEHATWERWTSDEGVVWAEECVIPAESVWRTSKASVFEMASHRSLLLPQVNFVSASGESQDAQAELEVDVAVERTPGTTVVAAYPEPYIGTHSWWVDLGTYWNSPVFFTNQPTLILEDRDAATRRELLLLLYGAAAGAVGTLLVAAITNTFGSLRD